MGRPAAMFFDIENIVGGYGKDFAKRVAAISLSAIEGQIADACPEAAGDFAVKRAYADWSKSDLRTLRKTIVEQGIEPRQVFGFGQGGIKNAADVELVIDVLELMYGREDVTTYVIVSGDGGFGSLVRKLHEFGKYVIVAGHADRASGALRAVCDQFVVLDRPEAPESSSVHAPTVRTGGAGPVPFQLLRAAVGPAPSRPADTADELLEIGSAIIAAVTTDPACLELLNGDGIRLVDMGNLFKGFLASDAIKSTFHGLRPFLSQLLEGSNWEVSKGGPGQSSMIVRREVSSTDQPPRIAGGLVLTTAERTSLEEAANGNPQELPHALASLLIAVHDRTDGASLEIGQFMQAAKGTGLSETAQKFFGTITQLVRMALGGTDLCVMQSTENPARHWVQSRIEFHGDVDAIRALEDLPLPTEPEMARTALRQASLKVPDDRDDIDDILRSIAKMPLAQDQSLNEFVARLVESETLPAAVELAPLRQMLSVLVAIGVFVGPNRTMTDWMNQPATQEMRDRAEILTRLREAVLEALRPYGLDNDEVLRDLLPLGGVTTSEGPARTTG